MRHALVTVMLAGTILTAADARANDQATYGGAKTYESTGAKNDAFAGAGPMLLDFIEWVLPLVGFPNDLERWKQAEGANILQMLRSTGMPGALVSVRRETTRSEVPRTSLVGGRPVLLGAGLDPKSIRLAYVREKKGDLDPHVSSGAYLDQSASEYLWVQEKNGKLVWGVMPAKGLDEEVRFTLADQHLMDTFARRYDADVAARAVDHMAVNDADESLRREARVLSEARNKALADAKRIDDDLRQALSREREANGVADTFQFIANIGNLAGSVASLVQTFPEKKPALDKAVASGSSTQVETVVFAIRNDAVIAAGMIRRKAQENAVHRHEIRNSEQRVLDRRHIREVVPGMWYPPSPPVPPPAPPAPRSDLGNGIPIGPMP